MSDYNATVSDRTEIAPGLIVLRVVPDQRPFTFVPGQYTTLGLKRSAPRVPESEPEVTEEGADPEKLIRRAYSIASSSRADHVEFYLTLVTSGELTPRLFMLQPGDRLFMGPKMTGHFTLDKVAPGKHVLLVATGTGLAPYMSMMRTELTCGGPRRFAVLHGARYSWDLGYRAELSGLAQQCPNFAYLPVVSRPEGDPSWGGLTGYLQDVLVGEPLARLGLSLDPAQVDVFLCGNPIMIETVKALLVERGFVVEKGKTPGQVHIEEYW